MGLFRPSKTKSQLTENTSSTQSQVDPARPFRPPRTRALSDTFKKFQADFERIREEEMHQAQLKAEKDNFGGRFRTGSVILRLNDAISKSAKTPQTILTAESSGDHAPIEQPKELSEILRSRLMRNAFRTFLQRKFASESLNCFETIELFNSVSNDDWRIKVAEGIMDRFILDTAESPINISSIDRLELIARHRTKFWHRITWRILSKCFTLRSL